MKAITGLLKDIQGINLPNTQLVMCAFDRKEDFKNHYTTLRNEFPKANIIGFSTAGHFVDDSINDEQAVFSAIAFQQSEVKCVSFNINNFKSSGELGSAIGTQFKDVSEIKGLSIISDGGLVNGTELIASINKEIDSTIPIFGGMAGDQARFESTFVGLNETPTNGNVVVTAFIGEKLVIKTGCKHGWNKMGVDFTITKSSKNILEELDHKNAYDTLYGLLEPKNEEEFNKNTLYYPFQLSASGQTDVIRTPIFVDHQNKTITYAGNMPEGQKVSLMKTGTMDLLDSTMEASKTALISDHKETFVFAISCVGRRVVLDDLASEEYSEIKATFGKNTKVFGFYSYGEFARGENEFKHCMLHNQTFAVASINELD